MLGDSISDFIWIEKRPAKKIHDEPEGDRFDSGVRLSIISLLVLGCFLVLFAGLINSQIFAGSYYRGLADGNRIKSVPIHALRGIIMDRNGIALTANLPSFRFNNQTVSKDQAIEIETEGGQPEIDSVRSYLFGPVFAHVLGYMQEFTGQDGVEKYYEKILRGKDGKELIEVDAIGKKLRTISVLRPVPGENLTLSLDYNLQKKAYEALADRKGAIVVSKPQTGEILALVSGPSFDPEKLANFLNHSNQPLFNRAISGTFPPGSTFKIITATAGLETGAINKNTFVEDTGVLVIGPYKFPNWKWLKNGGVDGNINVVQAITKSNDIFFYKTAELTGIDNLINWAKRFGLGQALGVDLPGEETGLVRKERNWYLGDTYHLAIGQGDLLVTPLQVNTWTNVIANGGKLCVPHVSGEKRCKDLGIKKETVDLITKGMLAACMPGGTGYPLFDFIPQVACKTGTAEYGPLTASGFATHAWFTAFVGDISITVLVEGGGEGSDVAAPIAKKVLQEWLSISGSPF